MTKSDTEDVVVSAGRYTGRWIGDLSAERVDHVWRPQDHEALLRNLRAADRLASQVAEFAAMTMLANQMLNLDEVLHK